MFDDVRTATFPVRAPTCSPPSVLPSSPASLPHPCLGPHPVVPPWAPLVKITTLIVVKDLARTGIAIRNDGPPPKPPAQMPLHSPRSGVHHQISTLHPPVPATLPSPDQAPVPVPPVPRALAAQSPNPGPSPLRGSPITFPMNPRSRCSVKPSGVPARQSSPRNWSVPRSSWAEKNKSFAQQGLSWRQSACSLPRPGRQENFLSRLPRRLRRL